MPYLCKELLTESSVLHSSRNSGCPSSKMEKGALFSFSTQFNPLSSDLIEPGVYLVPSAFRVSNTNIRRYLLTVAASCHSSKLAGTASPGTSTRRFSAHSIKFLTAHLVLISVFTGTTPLAACTICSSVHGEAYRLWLSSLDKGFLFRFRLKSHLFCFSAGIEKKNPTLCHFCFLRAFCHYHNQSLTYRYFPKSLIRTRSQEG